MFSVSLLSLFWFRFLSIGVHRTSSLFWLFALSVVSLRSLWSGLVWSGFCRLCFVSFYPLICKYSLSHVCLLCSHQKMQGLREALTASQMSGARDAPQDWTPLPPGFDMDRFEDDPTITKARLSAVDAYFRPPARDKFGDEIADARHSGTITLPPELIALITGYMLQPFIPHSFQLNVKTITGKVIPIECEWNWTALDLKQRISDRESHPAQGMRLMVVTPITDTAPPSVRYGDWWSAYDERLFAPSLSFPRPTPQNKPASTEPAPAQVYRTPFRDRDRLSFYYLLPATSVFMLLSMRGGSKWQPKKKALSLFM